MARIDLGDITLNYEWTGAAAGPVLVFVNGLLTELESWKQHLPHFADYRCLLWDCRGQGGSDKPVAPSYPVAAHSRDFGRLLDRLGVHERVDVIGLSNGGAAALGLAAQQPDRIRSLVVCGAYARADKALEFKLRSWIAAMQCGGGPLRFDVATPWVWGPRFLAEHWQTLVDYRVRGVALDCAVAERLIAGALEHDLGDEQLRRVRARTLVAVGADDLLTPPSMARVIAEGVPGARLKLLPGLGHAAALEDVEGFCELARGFLAAIVQR